MKKLILILSLAAFGGCSFRVEIKSKPTTPDYYHYVDENGEVKRVDNPKWRTMND